MIATVHLNFAVDIPPVFHVVPKGYDISSSSAVFELRDKNGAELYAESSDGITVETITLTAPLKYADGTEIAAGTEVSALRVAPDLSSLPLGDPDNIHAMQYWYGFRVDDVWKLQGYYTVWQDTGPAGCMGSPIAVCCGPVQVAVNVFGMDSTFAVGCVGVGTTEQRDNLINPVAGSQWSNTDRNSTIEVYDGATGLWLSPGNIPVQNKTGVTAKKGILLQLDYGGTEVIGEFSSIKTGRIGVVVYPETVESDEWMVLAMAGIVDVIFSRNTTVHLGYYVYPDLNNNYGFVRYTAPSDWCAVCLEDKTGNGVDDYYAKCYLTSPGRY